MTRRHRWRLVVTGDMAARLRQSPPELKRRVRIMLDAILEDPAIGKPLKDRLIEFRSARVGRFRIVYRVFTGAVRLLTVGLRRTVYEEAERLARRQEER